ncbi:gasdermin-C-like isoform X3 [Saccopteryx bilineata]|uniref:gasdermin-C-like isoform X3 n=1 Tax=Saccopteryx bilineata TaxID=59482 RepID=UPI00338E0E78
MEEEESSGFWVHEEGVRAEEATNMPSMFERATKALVKEIGDKELKPVKCLLNATKICRFSIVARKKAHSLFWELPDIPLDVSLLHILEPGTSAPDGAVKAPVLFSDTVFKKQQAGGNMDAGAGVNFSEEATQCHGSSFEYQIVTTPHETWTELQKRKLRGPEPSFLEACQKAAMNLYVVTETVELIKDTELKDRSSGSIVGKFSVNLKICGKSGGQRKGHKVSEKKLTVPQGSVLAYKRKQLVIKEEGWGFLCLNKWMFLEPGRIPNCFWQDCKHLQEEISRKIEETQLSKCTKGAVFSNIQAMLGDRKALQDLMGMLEQKPLGHLSGPGGIILNELQKNSDYPWGKPKDFILYLLKAIMVLSDIQLGLLACSMEKKILSQQRDLVRSILEPNFLCSGSVPFTLNPELLAPLQGESLSITYGLLAECGLKMELNSPTLAWEPEAKEPLCALYGALCILQHLTEASAPPGGQDWEFVL